MPEATRVLGVLAVGSAGFLLSEHCCSATALAAHVPKPFAPWVASSRRPGRLVADDRPVEPPHRCRIRRRRDAPSAANTMRVRIPAASPRSSPGVSLLVPDHPRHQSPARRTEGDVRLDPVAGAGSTFRRSGSPAKDARDAGLLPAEAADRGRARWPRRRGGDSRCSSPNPARSDLTDEDLVLVRDCGDRLGEVSCHVIHGPGLFVGSRGGCRPRPRGFLGVLVGVDVQRRHLGTVLRCTDAPALAGRTPICSGWRLRCCQSGWRRSAPCRRTRPCAHTT